MDLSALSYSHIYWIFLLPLIGAGADIATGWIQATVNGTWKVLNHWYQNGALGTAAAHGGQYYKGHLYLGNNDGTTCMVLKCIFRNNGVLEFQPLNFDARKVNSDDFKFTIIDGLCIHDGKMYVQPIGGAYSNGDLMIDVPV